MANEEAKKLVARYRYLADNIGGSDSDDPAELAKELREKADRLEAAIAAEQKIFIAK